jgi:GT2 family glycosyltransferase
MSDITIVIVNYRTPDHVASCLAALARERAAWPMFDVVVVDGGSGDDSVERLTAYINEREIGDWTALVPLTLNGGFGWANNEAIRRVMARANPPAFVHLLNPDAIVEPGAVQLLHDALLAEPRAACAGSLLTTEDGLAQGSAFDFLTIRSELARGANTGFVNRLFGCRPFVAATQTVEAEWVTGASVMIRVEALAQVGLFDEGFFLYFEEVELMYRLRRAGWTMLHVPASRVIHVGGASTGVADGASAMRRLPSYWFRSRRRYLALTRGPAATVMASSAWLLGAMLWKLRSIAGMGRAWSSHAPHEARDLTAHGVVPSREDMTPFIPSLTSAIDQPPAWMRLTDKARV